MSASLETLSFAYRVRSSLPALSQLSPNDVLRLSCTLHHVHHLSRCGAITLRQRCAVMCRGLHGLRQFVEACEAFIVQRLVGQHVPGSFLPRSEGADVS